MRKVLPYVVCGAVAFSFSTLTLACEGKVSAKDQPENAQKDANWSQTQQDGFHKVAKKKAKDSTKGKSGKT